MSDDEKKVQLEMDRAPAPPQQADMMNVPPPSYEEAMPGSVPISIPTIPTIPRNPDVRSLEFGSEPQKVSCWSRYRQEIYSQLMES